MRFLAYLKYLFLVAGITIFTLYIFSNGYINKYILALGYILVFSVPVWHKYEKQRKSHSPGEKNKLQK